VPEVGLEPTRGCPHRILSPIRIARWCVMLRYKARLWASLRLLAGYCVFLCVLTVTKIVTIFLQPKLGTTALILATTPSLSSALGRTRTCGLLIRSDTVDDQPGSSKVGQHLLVTHV